MLLALCIYLGVGIVWYIYTMIAMMDVFDFKSWKEMTTAFVMNVFFWPLIAVMYYSKQHK